MFKAIRGYPNSLETTSEMEAMLTLATNNVPPRFALGTNTPQHAAPLNTFWKIGDADRKLYSAIKFALKGQLRRHHGQDPHGPRF